MTFEDEEMNDEIEQLPLSDAIDTLILMHRDVHYGGKFPIMIEYYENGGKGIVLDFEIARIRELQLAEKNLGQDLAPQVLSGADAEKVAKAKEAYKKLRDLYGVRKDEKASAVSHYPSLLADLILSEEEEPKAEIAAIVAEKGAIVPALLDLLRSEDFHDPLFPGYGLGPSLAAKCLGLIGDKRAIVTLFETIGEEDFAFENLALEGLKAIGEPAQAFLLKVLHGRPITYDNERAAIGLLQFKDSPEVAAAFFKMLKEIDLSQHQILATYLILGCEGVTDETDRRAFIALGDALKTPKVLKQDFHTIAEHWKGKS
ncbi:MAG: hypothetical protein H0X51_02790 [Parachlamydiaceae bacterium]|nr:hypothetical protein [Parachlamydiaceae bacterium]